MDRIFRPAFAICMGLVAVLATSRCVAALEVDYLKQVKPLLQARCFACHGALKQEGGLRLDTAAAVRAGGDSGLILNISNPSASLLIERITTKDIDERMPPEGEGAALEHDEVDLLRVWIAAGATGPADEKPEVDPRDHWSFQSPERPAVPQVRNSAWIRNPIDAFIAAEHERISIKPQPDADAALLCRRLYLDLTGLPPTREQLDEFLADRSPHAYDTLVDKLLASPQYGERWGRHWMDVWRYSDWWGLGEDLRNSQKHIWHWRDWIVESLNADVGYDEMLRQMIAADELYPDDLDKLRATGYLARSYFKFNRNSWLEDVVEHLSKGVLGVTLNCARCHDHKYDPFPQTDYYGMRAFFEPYQVRTDLLPGEGDPQRDGIPRVFDCNLAEPTYLYVRGDETKPVKDKPIVPGFPAVLSLGDFEIEPITLPATAARPQLRPWIFENQVKLCEERLATARKDLATARQTPADGEKKSKEAKQDDAAKPNVEELRLTLTVAEKTLAEAELQLPTMRARGAADLARTTGTAEQAKTASLAAALLERTAAVAAAATSLAKLELAHLRAAENKRAAAKKKVDDAIAALKKAEAALAAKNDGKYTSLRGAFKAFESSTETADHRDLPFPTTSTGRRTALAKLLTDPRNPLVARVAVNHIWMRHMGKALVPTVFDFGRKGTPPTHPELLDWLAVELQEGARGQESGVSGPWSMKHIHRLIVTSSTYRMSASSAENTTAAKVDRDNVSYWHRTPIRLESQVVRDSLLQLAGELDLKMGGPTVPTVAEQFSNRRSLYFNHSNIDKHRFLVMFDDADVLECYRRDQSIVPQQALALANSKQSLETAAKIAERLHKTLENVDDDLFVRTAFSTILCYEPSDDERTACRDALTEWRKLPPPKGEDAAMRARMNLVHALLNHNDFVTMK